MFTPDEAFESITKRLIEKLQPACEKCAEMVGVELSTMLQSISEKHAGVYPRLVDEISRITEAEVRRSEEDCKVQLGMQILFELAYINTNHPDFMTKAAPKVSFSGLTLCTFAQHYFIVS